jgi:hypothetical protein
MHASEVELNDTINSFKFLVLSPPKEITVSMTLQKNPCKQNIRVLSINAMLTEWNLAQMIYSLKDFLLPE